MSDTLPRTIISRMEVPGLSGVYTLGPLARQVTFASQQTRALNLIWALFESDRLQEKDHIAIVGGGLAGITTAVAALMKGCKVDLFEQASQPCPIQRGNDLRYIHPNILNWPQPNSTDKNTDFPFLNWTAANVRSVIKQIDLQWKALSTMGELTEYFNYKVVGINSLDLEGTRPQIAANKVVDHHTDAKGIPASPGFIEGTYDGVILAVGFGEERSLSGMPFLSYWENDSLHQEIGNGIKTIMVSGCGDGGLIDALRLRLKNFQHAEFVAKFEADLGCHTATKLLDIESELIAFKSSHDISARFRARYDEIIIPSSIAEFFATQSRTDTIVILNSPDLGPLTYKSSILNRFATYLAIKYSDLHYVGGRVSAERTADGRYQVLIKSHLSDVEQLRVFDYLIIRHGPQGVIQSLLPFRAIEKLSKLWMATDDITVKRNWVDNESNSPHEFFTSYRIWPTPSPEGELDLALATFETAYRELAWQGEAISMAVGKRAGKISFIITLADSAPSRQPERFGNIPVYFEYRSPPAHAYTTDVDQSESDLRQQVHVGDGVYNWSAAVRKGIDQGIDETDAQQLQDLVGVGTVTCFAEETGSLPGAPFLISTAFVLSPDAEGQMGDYICLAGTTPHRNGPLASLRKIISSENGPASIDAAAAEISPNIEIVAIDSPRATIQQTDPRAPVHGEKVLKIGYGSGVTEGVINSAYTIARVTSENDPDRVFEACFEIVGDRNIDISAPGDAGALVTTIDGVPLGLIIAGSSDRRVGIACSLDRVLHEFNFKLVTSRST